jgi:hypothetical protein
MDCEVPPRDENCRQAVLGGRLRTNEATLGIDPTLKSVASDANRSWIAQSHVRTRMKRNGHSQSSRHTYQSSTFDFGVVDASHPVRTVEENIPSSCGGPQTVRYPPEHSVSRHLLMQSLVELSA